MTTVQEKRAAKRIARHIVNVGSADRGIAIRAEATLMRCYGVRASEPLMEACVSEDAQVRFRAGWVLAHTRDDRAYESLLRLTRDPDPSVRYDAAVALGILGDIRAVEPLIALLQEPDEEYAVDSAAAMGLERLGAAAVHALMQVTEDSTGDARIMAIHALGRVGDARATELLSRLAQGPVQELHAAANEALDEMAGSSSGEQMRNLRKRTYRR